MSNSTASLGQLQRVRKLVLLVLLIAAFGGLLFFASGSAGEDMHDAVEAVGISLIALAIIGRLWSTLYIGGRKSAEIVVLGPYSLTRNPLYLFSAIGAAGVGAQTGSVTVAAFFGVATALAFLVVIRREERFLAAQFGEPYRDYMATVPRLLPRLSGFQDTKQLVVNPRTLYSTFFDGLVFFLAIPAFETVEWLQHSGVFPVLLRLP